MQEPTKKILPATNSTMRRWRMVAWLVVPVLWLWVASVIWAEFVISGTGWWSGPAADQVLGASIEPVKEDLPAFEWRKTGLVTFWFDDAWLSQYEVGLPVLSKHDFVGAVAVPTHLIEYEAYMKWNQVQRLQFKGWEVTSHTRTHICDWTLVDKETVYEEIKLSQVDLWKHGLRADHFVAPCGASGDTLDLVKETYASSRTVHPGLNPLPVTDPYALKAHTIRLETTADDVAMWLDQAKREKSWLILMYHQIDDSETQYSATPETFEKMVEKVVESGLPVVLPSQALSVTK